MPPPAEFRATCWGEHTTVEVTPAEVKAGRTRSCGRSDCGTEEERRVLLRERAIARLGRAA